ncbi:MAG: exonuclease SbcCD subunit D [Microthrixaceae bacterium]
MKFIHTSDWHLGRRLGEHALLDDQRVFCDWLVELAVDEGAELVVVAGDVYDRDVPPTEAVALFRSTVRRLVDSGIKVAAIAGNHDSAERLSAYDGLTERAGVLVRGGFASAGELHRWEFSDGPLAVAAVGFLSPAALPGARAAEVEAAHAAAGRHGPWRTHDRVLAYHLDLARRAVEGAPRSLVISHAFVSGGLAGGSERQLAVGDAGQVAARRFDGFSYGALGHLHRSQTVNDRNELRYCGSPLAYSFSPDDGTRKEVLVVDLDRNGAVTVEAIPVEAGRPVILRRGRLSELVATAPQLDERSAYVRVELTDPVLPADARRVLGEHFPHLVEIGHLPDRSHRAPSRATSSEVRALEPIEAATQFWDELSPDPLTAADERLLAEVLADAFSAEADGAAAPSPVGTGARP